VVLITHDLAGAADRAERIAVMNAGRIVEQGTVRQILGSPSAPYTKALLAAAPTSGPVTAPRAAVRAGDEGGATALRVDGLGKRYVVPRRHRTSDVFAGVESVSFRIPAGRTMALVGESGSGKSTIARLVCRLLEPDHGRVFLGDTDLSNAKGGRLRDLRRRIQLVHQSTQASLDPRMSVGRSIREPLDSFRIGGRADRDRQVAELLDHVALPSSVLRRRPRELSGGQRQRAVIARALALSPSVVVLDEPVSALDVSIQAQILALLRRLQGELDLSYLFISHDLAVVRDIADTVAVMQDGRIVEHGPTEHVFCMPSTPYTQELIAAVPGQMSRVTHASEPAI
jgi:peptide/nickel transport system ATP-binding protein